jgi:hypothetical protein
MSEINKDFWRNVKNKIIGGVYSACYLNNFADNDIMNIMNALITDCGIITAEYDIKNILLHDSFLGTSDRFSILFYNRNVSPLAAIVNKIIYSQLTWPSAEYKTEIINIIFETLDEKTNGVLNEYLKPLANPAEKMPEGKPSELISALYGLVKFIMNNDKMKDISIIIEEVLNSPNVNKPVTNMLIGIVVGYNNMYKHQPFFKNRDTLDILLQNYLEYLYGEFNRIPIGSITVNKDNKKHLIYRFMHPQNMPVPAGWWAENLIPSDLNELAKLKIVSYIEDEHGFRYRSAIDYAYQIYGSALKVEDANNLNETDKKIVKIGNNNARGFYF